uniref:SH2 domain-containing protein n=1 Tax=Periophthalmus magnuspinnatus TaxID=409849 RepID=A0A3B4AXR9_9GOBI
MATAAWYHRDISRVHAEDLLARAGRDGSYLVRDSESVPGAYALCLLFQRHVHTYRILPDTDGLLAVQVRDNTVTVKMLYLWLKFNKKRTYRETMVCYRI